MANSGDEIASLRQALANAERARDETIAALGTAEQRRNDERQEELNRLRNLFSVVRVIARRTGDDAQTVEDYCGLLDGRLSAYLGVQAAVAHSWYEGSDLALLIANQLLAFGLKEGDQVELTGDTINLTSRAAVLLALAFHEITASAVLSGFFDDESHRLRVSWRLVEDGKDAGLSIEWMENVPGQPLVEARTSWVDWIEQAIAHQLSGMMVARRSGSDRLAMIHLPTSALA